MAGVSGAGRLEERAIAAGERMALGLGQLAGDAAGHISWELYPELIGTVAVVAVAEALVE